MGAVYDASVPLAEKKVVLVLVVALAVLLPAAASAQTPPPAAAPAPAPAPAPGLAGRTLEGTIGPLVLAAGGLSLVVIDLVSLASVGPSADGTKRTVIDETTFGLNLLVAGIALVAALAWWLMEGRPGGAEPAAGGMVGAADVI
jgi:hypothetical protein